MTRNASLLIAFLTIVTVGCKKDTDITTPVDPNGCLRKQLTLVKTKNQGDARITYNTDGMIMGNPDFPWTYFNRGQLMDYITPTDTVVLDSAGMLRYIKTVFGFDGGRQTRYYFYDGDKRLIRTITNTGNGINYLADLRWQNGDIVEVAYSIDNPGPGSSRFTFTYYDTVCADQYLSMGDWGQVGITMNRHLMKTSIYGGDSTHYDYRIDADNRVLASYRNYDNSAWTYSRAIDTTYYEYTCP